MIGQPTKHQKKESRNFKRLRVLCGDECKEWATIEKRLSSLYLEDLVISPSSVI